MAKSRQGKRTRGICTFCGRRRPLSSDHVPPKCLFGERGDRPNNLITVPACDQCNMKASGDDEYLRLTFVANIDASRHPIANSLLKPVSRSLQRPQAAGFARSFFASISTVDAYTRGGLYMGRFRGFRYDYPRIERAMQKIIRGLYREEYGKCLPRTHAVSVFFANSMQRAMSKDEFEGWRNGIREMLVGGRERNVGKGVLIYRCNRDANQIFRSLWALTFYGSLHFAGFTATAANYAKVKAASHLIATPY